MDTMTHVQLSIANGALVASETDITKNVVGSFDLAIHKLLDGDAVVVTAALAERIARTLEIATGRRAL